ncbi:MAG TPA: hypothetical protein VG755_27780 [Nannocystaceae bacterium]|nr:hypothetical protein [Nannocystaceae bacterium]
MKLGWLLLACACGPMVVPSDAETTSTSSASSIDETSSSTLSSAATTSPSSSSEGTTTWSLDLATPEDVRKLDVLFVIDNSANMADIQIWLAQAMAGFVETLSVTPHDVQVMFTTTDMGYSTCLSGAPAAKGNPVTTSCNHRIGDFSGSEETRDDACTSVCHSLWESPDAFIAFNTATGETNADPPDAGLACLLPQGIDGCGYEAPLEAMAQALNPDAWWNEGERPFVRDGADLAIVIASDESDCSLADQNATLDPKYWNFDPQMGSAHPSSALCWNAGIECEGPDADGVYAECTPREGPMHPTSRYIEMLQWLRDGGKRVTMLALSGVPEVTQYGATPPFEPTAGGLEALVYRDWRAADLFAEEQTDGVTPEDLYFEYDIGPACLAARDDGTRLARALPSPRLFEVCRALDEPDRVGCCIDSACSDPSAGLRCVLATSLL